MNILLISLLEEINPLGLLHISTYLKNNNYNVTTLFAPLNPKENEFGVEENRVIEKQEISEILALISRKSPSVIGLSLMTIHYHSAVKLTKRIKEEFSEIPVIWGGIHPTLLPEECIQHADIICRGEGEVAMLELMEHLRYGKPIKDLGSFWIKTKEEVVRNEVRPLVQDLDSFGFPRFDWQSCFVLNQDKIIKLTKENYQSYVPRNGHIYDVMVTRGCPYHCTYCCNASFKKLYSGKGKLLRSRSVDSVIQELGYVKEQFDFVKIINFQDDVFLIRKKDGWLDKFCQQYAEKIGLPFVCKGSPQEVTEENISMLKEAGMEYFHIGIQNSDRVNREVYKRITSNREKVIQASEVLHKYNIVARYDLILDDPFSTEEDILEVLDTLSRIRKPYVISCFSMTFFPGSEISKLAEEKGLLQKGKNGYLLKTTYAKRTYLNNLVEISPRVPRSFVKYFVKYRKTRFAETLLKYYIFIHYHLIFKTFYLVSKHPKLLSFVKNIRFRLSNARRS